MTTLVRVRPFLAIARLIPLLLLGGASANVSGCSDPTGHCCKVCKNSKACGDTCIPLTETCHTASGCACNG